jgi:WD40 repeat protein
VGKSNPLRLYSFEKGRPVEAIPTPQFTQVYDATFNDDATVIAATTSRNTVCIWEKSSGFRLVAELPESASRVQMSPRGNVLAARSGAGTAIYNRGIRVWRVFIPLPPGAY